MITFALFAITALIFLAIDAIGLHFLLRPIFERHVGDLLAQPLRLGPAAVFYLFYVAGLLYFVSLPALRSGEPVNAFLNGALFGLVAYGTYEMTNYATLRDWSIEQVAIDCLWGAALTGLAAWAGVAIVQRFI